MPPITYDYCNNYDHCYLLQQCSSFQIVTTMPIVNNCYNNGDLTSMIFSDKRAIKLTSKMSQLSKGENNIVFKLNLIIFRASRLLFNFKCYSLFSS